MEVMQCELAIQSWVWEERDRIEEETKAKEKAEKLAAKNGAETLSGRLKALKKKVAGGGSGVVK